MTAIKKMHSFQCRKAEKKDIETLTELLCELYENHSYEKLLSENTTHFANGRQAFFLAFELEKPIAVCHGSLRNEYVNGKEYDTTAGYLEAIYVRPEYRLCGIANTLVAMCEEWVSQNGCREFLSDCLLDNTDSYNFHLKIGFTESERCIFLRKDLASHTESNIAVFHLMLPTDIDLILAGFATQGWDKPREVLEGYLCEQKNGERKVVVAEVNGEIAGYVTLLPKAIDAVPFRGQNIAEIKDFIVFEKFQQRGVGTGLMDKIEQIAAEITDTVCLGVGLHSGYGAAQRLYVKRGYIPDGSGIWSGDRPAEQYGMVENGDELVMYMTKKLRLKYES